MFESFRVCELQVEGEVSRLEHLKSIKMKELILKKRIELEEICSNIHVVSEVYSPTIEHSYEAIESGKSLIQFILWEGLLLENAMLFFIRKKHR